MKPSKFEFHPIIVTIAQQNNYFFGRVKTTMDYLQDTCGPESSPPSKHVPASSLGAVSGTSFWKRWTASPTCKHHTDLLVPAKTLNPGLQLIDLEGLQGFGKELKSVILEAFLISHRRSTGFRTGSDIYWDIRYEKYREYHVQGLKGFCKELTFYRIQTLWNNV